MEGGRTVILPPPPSLNAGHFFPPSPPPLSLFSRGEGNPVEIAHFHEETKEEKKEEEEEEEGGFQTRISRQNTSERGAFLFLSSLPQHIFCFCERTHTYTYRYCTVLARQRKSKRFQ